MIAAKITHVLTNCHDQGILNSVQAIIQNMVANEDNNQQLHYLQSCGFGGLWRFAGPFVKVQNFFPLRFHVNFDSIRFDLFIFQSNCPVDGAELFVNCLEAMVETCLPLEEGEQNIVQYPSMLSVSSNMNLSSSLSSLTLGSPTDKGENP